MRKQQPRNTGDPPFREEVYREQSTEDEIYPHGVALCARNNICATVDVVQGRSHSLSDRGAFHLALIAFLCVVMVLLSGSSPTRLAGTDWLTRQVDDRVEQIEAPNHTAAPMVRLDIRFAEDLPEPTDDDETKHCLLRLDSVLRLDVPAFGSQTGLHELSDERALTPFRLRAFSTRGSPSA